MQAAYIRLEWSWTQIGSVPSYICGANVAIKNRIAQLSDAV